MIFWFLAIAITLIAGLLLIVFDHFVHEVPPTVGGILAFVVTTLIFWPVPFLFIIVIVVQEIGLL